MARQAFSKPADSTANLGFGADRHSLSIRHSDFIIPSAWVQHFIHHLAPQTASRCSAFLQSEASPQVVSEAKDNMAGFVLANGSMSSNQSGEGDIRRALIEADLVDCMVALPGQLFYSTQIPVCLWFSGKNNTLDSAIDTRLYDGETDLSLVA